MKTLYILCMYVCLHTHLAVCIHVSRVSVTAGLPSTAQDTLFLLNDTLWSEYGYFRIQCEQLAEAVDCVLGGKACMCWLKSC